MALIVTTQRIGIQTRYKRTERHKKQSFGIIYAIILTLKGNPAVARRASSNFSRGVERSETHGKWVENKMFPSGIISD